MNQRLRESTDHRWLAQQLGSAGLEPCEYGGCEITPSLWARIIKWLRSW